MSKNNVKLSKYIKTNYNDHIGFESENESDIYSIQTNNSFSSLSEIELQWDDDLDFKQTKKRLWSENCKKKQKLMSKTMEIWKR